MIEIEKTYLAKYIPDDLDRFPYHEICDFYIPADVEHPKIRIRKSGDSMNITKKEPLDDRDAGSQEEQTIALTEKEYGELLKLTGKEVSKTRYYYQKDNQKFEIDVFKNKLEGLVLVDVEFGSDEERNKFIAPDFCLAEVTQEKVMAGGMICGKSYEEIEEILNKYNYKKI